MRAATTKANIQSLVKNLAKSNLKSPAKSPAKRAGAVDHQEVDFEIVSCSSGDDEESIPTPKSNHNNSSKILGSKSSTNKQLSNTPLQNKQPLRNIETPHNEEGQSEIETIR